jgi:hypothetical protein
VKIARPTVGVGDRWLTGQSGAPPDSPVNYSHVAPFAFPEGDEFTVDDSPQSGAPPDRSVNYSRTPPSNP